jgi:hypothetical protein
VFNINHYSFEFWPIIKAFSEIPFGMLSDKNEKTLPLMGEGLGEG